VIAALVLVSTAAPAAAQAPSAALVDQLPVVTAVHSVEAALGGLTRWFGGARWAEVLAGAVSAEAAAAHAAAASLSPDLRVLTASPVPGTESSGFGWRDDPKNQRRKFHKGTDFRADRGTPVFAAGAATVAFAGHKGGYGKCVYLDHGGGVVTRYGHLSAITVRTGDTVPAATLIGKVGATGRATGPHLHFEVRLDGRAVDPNLALEVARLQQVDVAAATVAAAGLSPEASARALDRHDRRNRRTSAVTRPARVGGPERSRALW
jgi:murein DD-endopeptidase MepM/ murein hydrolase activator NlpD